MVDITKRSVKGSPLTNDEVDANFDNLNTGKVGTEDIGSDPNQVPLNQYLGTLAYQDLDAVNIDGGSIDGTIIGAATPAAGSFTTLQADTSLNVDGTVTADGLTVDGVVQISNATPTLQFTDTDNNYDATIQGLSGSLVLTADSGAEFGTESIQFKTGGSERMRIDSSGNVGIGTSSPAQKLDVTGTIRVKNGAVGYINGPTGEMLIGEDSIALYIGTGFGVNPAIPILFGSTGTTQIQFRSGGSESMRLDASGNLLVGTTTVNASGSNVAGVTAQADGRLDVSSTVEPLDVNRISTDGTIAKFRKNGTSVGIIGVDGVDFIIDSTQTDSAMALQWNDGGTLRKLQGYQTAFRMNTANDASVDLGGSTSRWKDLYLSGGVYLGGTGAANLLDDYETGEFTPAFAFSGGGSVTYSKQQAQYVKTGDLVTCTIALILSAISSPTGNITITGLPFTNGLGELYVSSASLGIVRDLSTARPEIRGYVNSNSTQITLSVNATDAGFSAMAATDLTATTGIYLTVSYRAA